MSVIRLFQFHILFKTSSCNQLQSLCQPVKQVYQCSRVHFSIFLTFVFSWLCNHYMNGNSSTKLVCWFNTNLIIPLLSFIFSVSFKTNSEYQNKYMNLHLDEQNSTKGWVKLKLKKNIGRKNCRILVIVIFYKKNKSFVLSLYFLSIFPLDYFDINLPCYHFMTT